MEVWDRLKAAREERGWSQSVMAGKLHMSQQKYHPYEHGREMKSGMILSVCAVLECSPNWLLGYHDTGMHLAPESLLLRQLKDAFEQLNGDGQQEAVKRVEELTELSRYTETKKGEAGTSTGA